jgi:death-on-curing protein
LPNKHVLFLSLDEVLEVHERVIDAYGGADGVRDLGLLESALYRPQSGYYEDLVTMAAALFESLLMNHPFVDGNKRAGALAAAVFLDLNGYDFRPPEIDVVNMIMGLAAGEIEEDSLAQWISENSTPKPE